jgi:hypothetical protein
MKAYTLRDRDNYPIAILSTKKEAEEIKQAYEERGYLNLMIT